MNILTTEKRAQIISILVEGGGINAACSITGVSKNAVLRLLAHLGSACAAYQDRVMRDLKIKRLECDETWLFVAMKQRNVPEQLKGIFGFGDVYIWTAICADSKLIPCWHAGTRTAESAYDFINDLATRLSNRVQLTTDEHKAYIDAIEDASGNDIDYAQLVKIYGNQGQSKDEARRYLPAECTGINKQRLIGNPNMRKVSTSYVERANLTMRMNLRRFTRLTNAFSRKLKNHMHAISLIFMVHNFCKIHSTLGISPAQSAGVDDHVWDIEEIIVMADTQDVTSRDSM